MEWVSKQVKWIFYIIKKYCYATFIDDFLCDFKLVMCIIEVALCYMQSFLTIQRDENWRYKAYMLIKHDYS